MGLEETETGGRKDKRWGNKGKIKEENEKKNCMGDVRGNENEKENMDIRRRKMGKE